MKKRVLSIVTAVAMVCTMLAMSFSNVFAAGTIAWSASPATQLSGWHYGGKNNAGAQVIQKMNEMDSDSVVSVTNGATNGYGGTAFTFNMNFTSGTAAEAYQNVGTMVEVNLDTTPYLYVKSPALATNVWYELHFGIDWGSAPKYGDNIFTAYTDKIDLRTVLGATGQQTFWVKLTLVSGQKTNAALPFDYLFIGNEEADPNYTKTDTITTLGGSASADVNVKYNATATTDAYIVDVTWGAMEFDYNAGAQKWNTQTHKWENDPNAVADWTVNNASNTITLANHSTKAVNASFAFTANAEYTDLDGAFTYENAPLEGSLALEMPQADTAAKEYVVSFTPSGSIPATHSTTTYAKMGSITVTITD